MSVFSIKKIEENENFNLEDFFENAPFTQADFYGQWQEWLGRKTEKYLISNEKDEPVAYFQFAKYSLFLKKIFLYAPYGPIIKNPSRDLIVFLQKEIKKITKKEKAVFFRLDFTPKIPDDLLSGLFNKSPEFTFYSPFFQHRVEWILDLSLSEEEILKSMHKNHRYSIRMSEQKEIEIEIVEKDFYQYFETFYNLMLQTSKRDGFNLLPKDFYRKVFQNLSSKNAFLSVARYKQKILVINLFIFFGKTANYVFGCSADQERQRLPAFLAQWKSIQHAKKIGCLLYNFGGTPKNKQKIDYSDGLTSFKKKFGCQPLIHSVFFDLIEDRFWYLIFVLKVLARKAFF